MDGRVGQALLPRLRVTCANPVRPCGMNMDGLAERIWIVFAVIGLGLVALGLIVGIAIGSMIA